MERPVAAGGVERFSSEERTSSGARRFLLIRCDHLGDLLMATPAMRALRRRHPDARIDVMASPGAASALAGNTDVDRVLLLDAPWYEPHHGRETEPLELLRAAGAILLEGYDAVVEMRGDPRLLALVAFSGAARRIGYAGVGLESVLTDAVRFDPYLCHLERNFEILNPLGVAGCSGSEDRMPVLTVDEATRRRASGLLRAAGVAPGAGYVVVAPATNRPRQTWGEAKFAEVAEGLRGTGCEVVLTGGESDAPVTAAVAAATRGAVIDLTGETDLPTLAAIIEGARLVLANDSGAIHIAAAVGCPAVAIFGPTSPALSFPYEGLPGYRSLAGPTSCERPCFRPGCEEGHGYRAVTLDAVLAACHAAMTSTEAPRNSGRADSSGPVPASIQP